MKDLDEIINNQLINLKKKEKKKKKNAYLRIVEYSIAFKTKLGNDNLYGI